MNPLLEKYEELYGPKVEETVENTIPEYNELPEGYLYRHCASGNYIGDTTYDAMTCHKIKWNGKYWEKISSDTLTGITSTDTIHLGTPFPSAYSNDYITFNTSSALTQPPASLTIDGKDIKDVIKEEVEKQLKKNKSLSEQFDKIVSEWKSGDGVVTDIKTQYDHRDPQHTSTLYTVTIRVD